MARLRTRLLDLAVATLAVALVASPFLAQGFADSGSLVQQQLSVDEHVKAAAVISIPYNGSFSLDHSGRSTGSVAWDVFSTDPKGFKLSVNTDRVPAMRDNNASDRIDDYTATPSAWSVPAGQRRFGFSSTGAFAMGEFDSGNRWRGFNGVRGIDVARHLKGPTAMSRTTLRLASEMKSSLGSGSHPKAWILATATVNI